MALKLLLVYAIFSFGLPEILSATIPCLKPNPQSSFTYSACNINHTLNQLLIYQLCFGAALALFVYGRTLRLKSTFLFAVAIGIIAIASFYTALPRLETTTNSAPVQIDSVPQNPL